ncbi:DNA-binding protein, partial [Halobacteriales archaeon QH_8_67_27]
FESTAFVGEYSLVASEDDRRRYRIRPGTSMAEQLGDHLDDLDDLRALYEAPLHIESIHAAPAGWRQRGRFADRNAFDEVRTFWQRNDVPFHLYRLTSDDADDRFAAADDGLTDAQRAAVRTAYEMGHFDVPRRASLEDVADELGISASSCSERLRRAQTHLVETHFEEKPQSGERSR